MHEASIVEYTLRAVEKAAKSRGISTVTEINLVIGKLKVAVPDILRYSYDLLIKGTMFEVAKLNIEEVDVVIHCEGCGNNLKIDDFSVEKCPCCGGQHVRVIQGNELMISSFRGE